MTSADWTGAIERARANAPFLARSLDRQEELATLLEAGQGAAALKWSAARGEHEDVAVGLRRHRLALATTLAIGDLAGAFPLSQVMAHLSAFADHALDTAIRAAIEERTGSPGPDGFIALALGKQGAAELNYSSDIDPILLYDRARLKCRDGDEPGEAAQRYARRIIKLLSENTAEGYVLRVDLRLRPAAEISPLVVPRASALTHYQGQALAWERAAFTRARAAAGDVEAGEQFLSEVAPFVWRQALDFGAIEEIRALTHRIRESHDGPSRPGPGFNVKRGRGGIREIEFFVQTHQLIHGGRDRSLRVRGTRAAIDALVNADRVDSGEARILAMAYDRLRTVEHRLQMVNDRQTHALPDGSELDAVARLDGLCDGAELVSELTDLTQRTAAIYDSLIGQEQHPVSDLPRASDRAQLARRLGFDDPERLSAKIGEWRDGRYACIRTPQAIDAFDRLLPLLLEAFAESDDPARAIARWQGILERSQSAITVFRLLVAEPDLLDRLVAALTLSPILADEIARRPETLDVLIERDSIAFDDLFGSTLEQMRQGPERGDYEARLDCIRQVTSEARFTLGIGLITGEYKPSLIGAALSHVAEAAVVAAYEAASEEFIVKHGAFDENELVALGLGRLGGGALTHASDLDMIYLFTGDFAAQSDGERSLGATLYFNRLASRMSAALSVPTAQGVLYEVDTRLRPQGKQGPLAVSVDAFAKYQRESAWTWEHMAINRARVLAGSDAARDRVEAVIRNVQRLERDPNKLCNDILAMHAELAKHKPARGPLDVKLLRGGLVDVEFLVHFLQLRHGFEAPDEPVGFLSPDFAKAIPALEQRGLVDHHLWPAYDLMTDMLVAGRLLAPDGKTLPQAAAKALAKACGRSSYAELDRDLAVARRQVTSSWAQIFRQTLETD